MNNTSLKTMEMLYDTYVDDIFRYIQFRTRNKEKALDLTQEVFVRVWQSYVSKDKEIEFPKALIYRVAHNLLVNSYERDIHHDSLDTLSEDGFDITDESQNISKITDSADLYQALDLLSKKDSDLIILRHIEGFSVKEIAEMHKVTENVLSVRLHRALNQLEEIYNKNSETQNEQQ
jgi:RNA polymerase sigma-70 factor (ECF subfamily)